MPNVGEVVDQPPADVVTCRGVLAARIPETDYDLQSLSNNYFLPGDSPPFLPGDSAPPSPSSSSPGPLPMTSGSAAPSAAPTTGVSSITARGAARTATDVSGSSRISTPSGRLMSLTWSESPITM